MMKKKLLLNQLKSSGRGLSFALLLMLLPLGVWAQESPEINGIYAFPYNGLQYSLSFGWIPSSDFDQLYYTVDGGKEMQYNPDADNLVEKPCTVEAYIKNNDGIIAGTQKTLYVYAFSRFTGTAVYGQSATLPGFTPALAGSETVYYLTYSDAVEVNESTGELTITGVGEATIQASFSILEEQQPDYFVCSDTTNYHLTVLPPAPEIADATVEGDDIVISISNPPADAQIYYSWNENDGNGSLYTTNDPPKAQNGTLYAWVVANSKDGQSFKSEKTSKTFDVKRSIEEAEIAMNAESFTYTGSEIEPEVTVKYPVISLETGPDYITLVQGTDYTVSYINNVNVPEPDSNDQPQVIITGMGNYTGTARGWFGIDQADFSEVTIAPIVDQTWLGTAIEPEVTITYNGNSVSSDEYGLEYVNNDGIGTATVQVYCNEKNFFLEGQEYIPVNFNIVQAIATITADAEQTATYDGDAHEVQASVDEDGTLEYTYYESEEARASKLGGTSTPPTDAGTYYVTVTFSSDYYSAEPVEVTFTIQKAESAVTEEPKALVLVYTGEPQALVEAGEATGGQLVYSLTEDGGFTEDIPTGTEAQVYTVYYKVLGDDNHEDSQVGSVQATISKAEASLAFSGDEVTVALGETLTVPVLSNPHQVEVTYSSSNEQVATVDAETGEVTLVGIGETTITATVVDNDNYENETASYVLTVTGVAYPLTVGGVVVTENNRTSLFNGSVSYVPESNLLKLKDAELDGGIEVSRGIDQLTIHLEGTNSITGSAIVTSDATLSSLEIQQTNSGSLTFVKTTSGSIQKIEDAFYGVAPDAITFSNNLTAELLSDHYGVSISCLLEPIIDKSGETKEVNPASDLAGQTTEQLAQGYEKNGIYYTLPDENDGTIPGENILALNSQMSQEDVNRIAKDLADGINLPGTPAFNQDFHGLALLLNPGRYDIELEVRTGENTLNVMVGDEAPLHLKATDDFLSYTFAVTVDKPTYVLIYCYPSNSTDQYEEPVNARRVPGRKLATTTEMKKIKVKASAVSTAKAPLSDYKKLNKEDIVIPVGGGHIVIDDLEVTDLADDVFEDLAVMSASGERRASGTGDYTYIDLSGTNILGMNFDRHSGPFKNIPLNTFIYLPAGNIVGSPNMIVGAVCKDVQLSPNHDFEAPYGFDAARLTLNRAFSSDEKQPVCLPIAIEDTEDYGQFYSFDEVKNGVIQMKKTSRVEAGKGYFLQAKEGGLSSFTADNVFVRDAEPDSPATGLLGTYSATSQSDVYVYDDATKAFKRMSSSDFLPFEAYLRLTGLGETLAANWEGEPTGIDALRMSQQQDGAWYTLDGRKLNAIPVQKGVYLHNGKKIVVK